MDILELLESTDANRLIQGDPINFAIVIIVSIIFGSLLYLLYNLYFQDNEPQDGSLARSLVLLTPALTSTFWMIQSSMILSLGLLGSLSFVRFRTPVKRAEDVTFIVVALAVAISCATMNFIIGGMLILILFGFVVGKNMFSKFYYEKGKNAIVTFNTKKEMNTTTLRNSFSKIGLNATFVSSRTYDGITSFVYNISKLNRDKHDNLSETLLALDKDANFNVFYPNDRLGV